MVKKVFVVSKSKGAEEKSPIPRIRICGKWLVPLGFESNKFVSVICKNEFIELELEKPNIDFSRIRSKDGFLKVGKSHNKTSDGFSPIITVRGYWLNDIGFATGSIAVVNCDVGKITIRVIKNEQL
jgi:hypothetical protein